MDSVSLKLTISEILSLTNKLPKEIKLFLAKKWVQELAQDAVDTSDLTIEGFEQSFDLESAAFTEDQLKPLQVLWKDELPADDLVKMLTT